MTIDAPRLAAARAARAADLIEVFSAIQGEGPRVGERHLFVRFLHCDMACAYCDTPLCHSWQPAWRLEHTPGGRDFVRRPNPEPFADLLPLVIERACGAVRHAAVSFTGGEPCLQPEAIAALAPSIRARGVRTLLETDGNLPDLFAGIREHIDIVSMDWKLASATGESTRVAEHQAFLKLAQGAETWVKLVFVDETPVAEVVAAVEAVTAIAPHLVLVLQPATACGTVRRTPSPATTLRLHDAALAVHRDVRVIPQVHRLMGQP